MDLRNEMKYPCDGRLIAEMGPNALTPAICGLVLSPPLLCKLNLVTQFLRNRT